MNKIEKALKKIKILRVWDEKEKEIINAEIIHPVGVFFKNKEMIMMIKSKKCKSVKKKAVCK